MTGSGRYTCFRAHNIEMTSSWWRRAAVLFAALVCLFPPALSRPDIAKAADGPCGAQECPPPGSIPNEPCGPNPCPSPGSVPEGPCGAKPCPPPSGSQGACGPGECKPATESAVGACGANPCPPASPAPGGCGNKECPPPVAVSDVAATGPSPSAGAAAQAGPTPSAAGSTTPEAGATPGADALEESATAKARNAQDGDDSLPVGLAALGLVLVAAAALTVYQVKRRSRQVL